MKRELNSIIADLEAGRGPQVLLVFGEDLRVAESCAAIVDRLVPSERRGFNFERFDGRSASWEQIETSILTPPFFPGKKLLWVDGATYFYAREQSTELREKVLDLWRDGKRDDAAKALLDLLVVEGWTQERWETLDCPAVLFQALGSALGSASDQDQDEVLALLAYC